MKKRPLSLKVYSFVMIFVALSLPVQICWLYEVPIYEVAEWWRLLTGLNLLTMGLMLLSGVLAYQGARSILFMAPLTFGVVALNNWWVGYVGTEFSLLTTSLASGSFLALQLVLLEKGALRALIDQKSQWWRAAERRQLTLPITLYPWVGESLVAKTFDISESGAFVTLDPSRGLHVGDRLEMRLSLNERQVIRCTARLVRVASPRGVYPQGLAVKFENLTSHDRRSLRSLVDR